MAQQFLGELANYLQPANHMRTCVRQLSLPLVGGDMGKTCLGLFLDDTEDRRNEAVAATRDVGDVAPAVLAIAERAANGGHMDSQAALVDVGMGPDALHQLLLGQELARPLDMTLSAVVQHLAVLEASGLVRSHKVGRVRTCRIEPTALHSAERWIGERRASWEKRLDRLGAFLAETEPTDDSRSK